MNGRIEFEINGVTHCLVFNTMAVRIFTTKTFEQVSALPNADKLSEKEIKASIDQDKSFADMVYAGLCGLATENGKTHTDYSAAYQLTEDILYSKDKSIQSKINEAYLESRATKAQIDKMNALSTEKKSDVQN